MSFLAPVLGIASAAGSLFGGKDKPQQSSSSNQAYGQLNSTYAPQTQTGVASNNFMSQLLGVGSGTPEAGFERYKAMAGYAPALQQLQSGITQGAASRGLLNSGSTQKALVKYGAGLDQQMFNNYFQNLNDVNKSGLSAGNLISGAGNVSSGTGPQPGFGSQLGSAIGSIPALTKGYQDIGHIFS